MYIYIYISYITYTLKWPFLFSLLLFLFLPFLHFLLLIQSLLFSRCNTMSCLWGQLVRWSLKMTRAFWSQRALAVVLWAALSLTNSPDVQSLTLKPLELLVFNQQTETYLRTFWALWSRSTTWSNRSRLRLVLGGGAVFLWHHLTLPSALLFNIWLDLLLISFTCILF